VDAVRLKNDNVFGTQVLLDFDTYQVLGWKRIDGTEWTFSTDYLSDRGLALGTDFRYDRPEFLGVPGRATGFLDAWGIKEEGLDNLGFDRRVLLPEEEYRGRVLGRHRQQLAGGFQFTAEAGLISDRNFLEQYFEQEWDQEKDQITGLELKRYVGNSSWSLTADVRVNDFFTQTERLPRLDHFLTGQSVFGFLTWHGHSQAGYEHLRPAVPPDPRNPTEVALFDPLAWETDAEGLRVATRQELDWPVQLGAVKVVPYVLGEAAHWGEDLTGNELTRYLGQTGVRASLPFWRVDPMVQSTLFNLNGLAHKVLLETEFLYADAEENLSSLPLYDPVDDDSTEHFRRRLFFNTFGGPAGVGGPNVPLMFDERYFLLRSGIQSWVASPTTEVADDLMLAKVAVRQRWQTKRGAPGQERIVDWIEFDAEGVYFPKEDEDNFGEPWGLLNYDFRWHVGDRLTLLSDGFADVFGQGLRTATLGALINRPERGSLYVGIRSIEGPISSNIVTSAVSYRMSEKWIFTGAASFDFGETGNIGQSIQLTRIGESALVRLGFNYDASRNNLGVNLAIEPRFLASSRLGRIGGVQIPPAGAYGLE
ncbi:MAG: organic solvent tolerance protein OstA, partial [Pirellulaceae bacterium]